MRSQGYSGVRRRPKPWLIGLIVLGHLAGFYLLARALVPEFTSAVERDVSSALTVVVTAPDEEEPDPPPPDPEPQAEPDEGEQGAPAKKATPREEKAPEPKIKITENPAPKTSSTGTSNRSGTKEEGEGTGASGSGDGTGSGNSGTGRGGGFPVTKPEHISGSINNARDYPVPEGGRKARRGTSVIVKVTVGTNGRASNCSVYRASPDAEADRITCQLVTSRLRFKPAQDANGDPIAAPFYWQQKWF